MKKEGMQFKDSKEGFLGDTGGGKGRGKCYNYIVILKLKKEGNTIH